MHMAHEMSRLLRELFQAFAASRANHSVSEQLFGGEDESAWSLLSSVLSRYALRGAADAAVP